MLASLFCIGEEKERFLKGSTPYLTFYKVIAVKMQAYETVAN